MLQFFLKRKEITKFLISDIIYRLKSACLQAILILSSAKNFSHEHDGLREMMKRGMIKKRNNDKINVFLPSQLLPSS